MYRWLDIAFYWVLPVLLLTVGTLLFRQGGNVAPFGIGCWGSASVLIGGNLFLKPKSFREVFSDETDCLDEM